MIDRAGSGAARGVDSRAEISPDATIKTDHLEVSAGVSIAAGVHIEARSVIIGPDTQIGAGVRIEADRLVLGTNCLIFPLVRIKVQRDCILDEHTKISHHCVLKAGSLHLGAEFWMNHHAEVGGGGWDRGRGALRTGEHCHIGRYAHVNTAEPVVLGRRTAVGMDSIIATHAHWQPALDGYQRRLGPVTVGDDVSIYSRAVLSPGVELGDGSVVAAGAVVVEGFPPGSVIGGVPARLLRTIRVADRTRVEYAADLWGELAGVIGAERVMGSLRCDLGTATWTTTTQGGILEVLSAGPKPPARSRFDLDNLTMTGMQSALSEIVRSWLKDEGLRFTRDGYQLPRRTMDDLVRRGVEEWE